MCLHVRNHFNTLLHGSNCNKFTNTFASIMIAYNKHRCTIHFLSIAENECINNCISLMKTIAIMSEITSNIYDFSMLISFSFHCRN